MTIQIPLTAAPADVASILQPARRCWRARLAGLMRAAMQRDASFRAARQLARLEDRLLRDIGLTREDVRGRRR